MKRFNLLLLSVASLLLWASCDDMNDIHKEYVEKGEKVYLGKVDSIKTYSGLNSVKLTWYVTADPKVRKTVIYWNMRKDSIIKTLNRTAPGIIKDSLVVNGLPEDTYVFEFRNINDEGQSSLFSSATGKAWGEDFVKGLKSRLPVVLDYSGSNSLYALSLSKNNLNNELVYSEIRYTPINGSEKVVRVDKDSVSVILPDFREGASFEIRSAFMPSTGYETVFSNYTTYSSPVSQTATGVKVLTLATTQGSNFFTIGDKLYQRNTPGDLIEYKMNESGQLVENSKISALAPVSTFKVFFFQYPDRFLGVRSNNAIDMVQLVNNKLVTIKASLGSGFNFQHFVPYRDVFYSVNNGEVKRWVPQSNGTWGSPNGNTVSTDFASYAIISSYNNLSILGVDAAGYLWAYPVGSDGSLPTKLKIGQGWNKYKQIIPYEDKLLCLDANGQFWLHNFSVYGTFWTL